MKIIERFDSNGDWISTSRTTGEWTMSTEYKNAVEAMLEGTEAYDPKSNNYQVPAELLKWLRLVHIHMSGQKIRLPGDRS